MVQNDKVTSEKYAAAEAAGRELISSALQRNPLVALGASIAMPIVSLFRGRRSKPAAAVRKMKLESYSYSPVQTGPRQHEVETEGTSKASRSHTEGTRKGVSKRSCPVGPCVSTKNGGLHHG